MRLMVESYPQFLRSPLGTPGTMIHHLVRTHQKKKKKKKNACISRVSQLKQARLKRSYLKRKKKRKISFWVRARFVHSIFFIFYFIFKNRKSQFTLLFSFSCLTIYRGRTLIYVKHIVLLNCQLRSPMPIYIRKKSVEIFKIYQNCRNHVQFNSSVRKKGHFLFSFSFY